MNESTKKSAILNNESWKTEIVTKGGVLSSKRLKDVENVTYIKIDS